MELRKISQPSSSETAKLRAILSFNYVKACKLKGTTFFNQLEMRNDWFMENADEPNHLSLPHTDKHIIELQ